jgi:hypothetical protein
VSGHWRTLVLLVGLCAVLAGCGATGTQEGGECSGGEIHGDHCVPYSAGQEAALILGGMPIPPRNEYPQRTPTCSVKGDVATCEEFDHMGNLIRAQFKIVTREGRSNTLEPICPSAKHPNRSGSVFCTD